MRSKLFGRLMSFTLSATVALTSGIPALAYDGGGGDLPEEDVELLEEEVVEEDLEETGAISDAEEIVLDEEVEEDVSFAEEEEEEEEEAEFEALNDLTVSFAGTTAAHVTVHDMNGTDYQASSITSIGVDATQSYSFVVAPDAGYVLPSSLIVAITDEANTGAAGTFYLSYNDIEATSTTAWSDNATYVEVKKVTSDTAIGYTVSDFSVDKKCKVVTLNKALLEDVLAKFVDKNGKWAGRQDSTHLTTIKKSVRPTLKLTFNAASVETYVVNQPTAKGGATAVEVIEARRSLTTKAYNNTDTTSTWSKIVGIDLEGTDYDIDDAAITIKLSKNGKAIDDTTITWATANDVILKAETAVTKAASVTSATLDMPTAGQAIWDKGSDTLYLFQGLVNTAYTNGWTMDIEIDVTQVPVAKNAISVADATFAKVVKKNTTAMPTEYEKASSLVLTVTGLPDDDGNARTVKKVEYSANGSEKVTLSAASAPDYTIPANLEGPVVVYVTTSETITTAVYKPDVSGALTAATEATIYDENGATPTRAISGKPYKFFVTTEAGYKVDKVEYKIKGETKSSDLKADANGIYTTANVTDTLIINVTLASGVATYNVERVDAADSTILDKNSGYTIDDDATAGAATDGRNAATHNRQYYFTVKPVGASKMVTKVTYTIGASATVYEATLVSGDPSDATNGAVYKTEPVTGNIKITATVKDYQTLTVNAGNAADVLLNGKKITTGVKVAKGTDAVITVAPMSDNYSITKIYYDSAVPGKLLGEKAGTYSINMGANHEIIVMTEQTADPSKYYVEFKSKDETGKEETDKLQNKYDAENKLTSQSLTLEVGETAKLSQTSYKTAVVFKKGGTSLTDSDGTLTFKMAKELGSVKVADVAADAITGYKAGSDVITAKFEIPDANHSNNTIVYTGELPLTVVDQYKDLYISAPATSIMEGTSTTLTVKGTNGRTGDEVTIKATDTTKKIGKVVFSFEPDITTVATKEYGFGTSPLTATAEITTANAAATTAFTVDKAQASPIKVVATIYKPNNTDIYTTLTKEFTTVESTRYYVVPTITMSEGMTYTIDDSATTPTAFALDVSGNKKTANVTFDVYQRIDDTYSPAGTVADFKDAETKGKIKKVDQSRVSYKTSVVYSADPAGKRPVDYVTVSGSAGKFTVTGVKKTAGGQKETVTIVASIDGIIIGSASKDFTVTEKIANTEVTFTTAARKLSGVATATYEDEDGVATNTATDAVLIKNSLKSDYLTGYEKSIVEDATREYEEGALYRVEDGSVITLPTESDFVTSTRDKRAILVGWALTDATHPEYVKAINGAAYDVDAANGADKAFAPGAKLAIVHSVGFTAVWAPRYDITSATINNGQIKTQITDNEATAAAQAIDPLAAAVKMDAYNTAISTLAKGVTVPAVIKAQRAWSIDPATGAPVKQPVYISTGFSLAYADGTTASQQSAITLSGTKLTAKAIASTTEVGDVEASITDSEGGTWTVVSSGSLAVAKETTRTVAFAKQGSTPALIVGDLTDLDEDSKLAKLTLEKSEVLSAKAVWPVIFESGVGGLVSDLSSGYQVEYSIDKSTVVKFATNSGYTGVDKFKLDVTPLAIGTANLTVTITDAAGNKCTGTLPIEVIDDKVEIQFTDKDKNAITSVEAIGDNALGTTEGVGEIYVKAILKEDSSSLSGTWAITNTEAGVTSEIVAGMIEDVDAGDGSGRKILRINTATTKPILGTDSKNVYVTFNTGTKTYRKQITVTTFYNIVLKGTDTYDSASYVYDGGKSDFLFVLVDGVRQKDAKKTVSEEQDYPALTTRIKVTEANQKVVRTSAGAISTQSVNLDLSKYTAEMVKNKKVVTTGEFKQWWLDADNDFVFDGSENGVGKTLVKDLDYDNFTNGEYVLAPEMGATTISAVVPSVSSITLTNEKGKNFANVALTLTPETTADNIRVYADNYDFFNITPDDKWTVAADGSVKDVSNSAVTPIPEAAGISQVDAISGIDLTNTSGSSKFVVSMVADVAGKTNLKIYSAADVTPTEVEIDPDVTPNSGDEYNEPDLTKCKLLATIPLRIDGLNQVSPTEIYYIEDGEQLKGVARKIGEDTFVFGDDGKQILGSKVYKLADGTSILIRSDKATTEGVWTIDADTYVTDENGIILSGWQTYADKKYYADPTDDNKAVDGFQKIDGKYYYFRSHALVTASSNANIYELVSGTNYYVNAAGEVAVGGIFAVAGVNRLFREDGTIVKHNDSDVVNGKIKVGGIGYIIHDDDSAEFDDILYNATVKWLDNFESTYTKGSGLPIIRYAITYTSKNTGKRATTDDLYALVTCDGSYADTSTAEKLTFTATASLEGYWKDANATTPATEATKSITYKFKDGGLVGTAGEDISNGGTIYAEGLEESYPYTGVKITPAVVVTDNGEPLAKGVDYTISYKDNLKLSPKNSDGEYTASAQIIIKGKGNYEGQAQTLYFAIVDPRDDVDKAELKNVKGAKVTLSSETHVYNGEAHFPETVTLTLKDKTVAGVYTYDGNGGYTCDKDDLPATVSVVNNVNAGKATVVLTGMDVTSGKKTVATTAKATFKIEKADLTAADSAGQPLLEVSLGESYYWAAKGVKPDDIVVKYNGEDLVLGADYTVTYSNFKKITTSAKPATITIAAKGSGNYKGKAKNVKSYQIVPLELQEGNIAAISAVGGKKGSTVKATIVDNYGNVIPAGKFAIKVYDGETDMTKANLVAGTSYKVVITKKNAKVTEIADGELEAAVVPGLDFGKAKVAVAKGFAKTYTGSAITLDDDDFKSITVTYGKEKKVLTLGTDFEIVEEGYQNNVKKGNMTVTIRGKEDAGFTGFKTFKIKIAPKPLQKATN